MQPSKLGGGGNKYTSIRLEASRLKPGETSNDLKCPWCSGGSSNDASFYITHSRDGRAVYICHRASCGRAGTCQLGPVRELHSLGDVPKKFEPNPLISSTVYMILEERAELYNKYGIGVQWPPYAGWCYDTLGKLVLPVYSNDRRTRGHVTREVLSNGKKVVRSWKVLDEPWQCWYLAPNSSVLIIVEDQISALRIRQEGISSLALLGTLLSPEKVDEIRNSFVTQTPSPKVVLCLDKDATAKAIKYQRQYGAYLGNFHVECLSKGDVKDLSDKEFKEFIDTVLA